jgi:cytochrome b subunit of formate dehydrogenase
MAETNNAPEAQKSDRYLGRLARISAWLLLAAVVVLVVSGWGITQTGIIHKWTFGLIDRRLADSIHRAATIPLAFFFLSHVLINVDLAFQRRTRRYTWLVHLILIVIGLAFLGIAVYVEHGSVP